MSIMKKPVNQFLWLVGFYMKNVILASLMVTFNKHLATGLNLKILARSIFNIK